jgi:hypothetical protein
MKGHKKIVLKRRTFFALDFGFMQRAFVKYVYVIVYALTK